MSGASACRNRWLLVGTTRIITVVLLVLICFGQVRSQYEPEEGEIHGYYQADTSGADTGAYVVIDPHRHIWRDSSRYCNDTDWTADSYEIWEVMNGGHVLEAVDLYWNKTKILFKVKPTYTLQQKEYKLLLEIHYKIICNTTDGEEAQYRHSQVEVILKPLSVQLLEPPGGVTEGQPLRLICSIFGGHGLPESAIIANDAQLSENEVQIDFCSSQLNGTCQEGFNCTNQSSALLFNYTCYLNSHSDGSNSGYYTCHIIVKHNIISSNDVKVEVKQDWSTVEISSATAGIVAIIVLITLIIINIIGIEYICIVRRIRNPNPNPVPRPRRDRAVVPRARGRGERERLLPARARDLEHISEERIEENQVDRVNEQYAHGGLDSRRLEETLDPRPVGRITPVRLAGSVLPKEDDPLSDNEQYESATDM